MPQEPKPENWQDDTTQDVNIAQDNKPTLNEIDNEALQNAVQKRTLSQVAFYISGIAALLAVFMIFSVICRVIFSNPCILLALKDLWHIYLITVVALTTTLGILLAFNRGTWKEADKKDDDKLDSVPQIKSIVELIEAVKKIG